ncbi:MAG: PKD domain-containing protein, partial [Candidatus Hermodarchaeota archaeon]
MLSLGELSIESFYCDAEYIGYKRYKADVNQEIEFICDIQDANLTYAIMGDQSPPLVFTGNTFNYTYSEEGIYNISVWAGSILDGWISDWLIIQVENDAPEFDIGFSVVNYYEATYDFEDDVIGDAPNNWDTYNDKMIFYASENSYVYDGTSLEGSYLNLKYEDNIIWKVRTEIDSWWYRSYFGIGIDIYTGYEDAFTPGYYKLYFSASDDVVVEDSSKTLFEGNYCYGEIVYLEYHWIEITYEEIIDPDDWDYTIVDIDWFQLIKVESEGVVVTKDVDDHGKVVSLNYRNSSRFCGMAQSFSAQTTGTLEFWYRTRDSDIETNFRLDQQQKLTQKEGSWFLNDFNITSEVGVIPNNNEWFHIRIDWRDYNTPSYLDLDLGEFRIFINNHQSSDFTLSTLGSGVASFAIEANGSIYIDAVGFTWEDYDIGDNLVVIYPDHIYNDQEITFSLINLEESEIDKSGFAYYKDEPIGENYTYLWDFGDGNYSSDKQPSYKFSHPGEYPIRLTLIDDQGAMTTKVRNLTIDNKIPLSEINYGVNFDATFDFKEDIVGESPGGWYCTENVKVIESKGKFSKVVEIDTTEGGLGMMSIPEVIRRSNDQVEFWVYFSDIHKDDFFFWAEPDYERDDLENPAPTHISQCFRFGLIDGKWKYLVKYNNNFYWIEMPELPDPESNEWIHVRFMVDYNSRTFTIFINGESSNSYEHMGGGGFVPVRLGMYAYANSHVYIDSIGFSWDRNYQIGVNNPISFYSHYGTWDFRYYPDEEVPYDEDLDLSVLGPWVFTSNDYDKLADGCLAQIIPKIDGHYKVLELQDNNNEDIIQASLIDLEKPEYGTIEFWIRTTDISQGLIIALGYQGFRTGIWLGNDGSWWYQRDSTKYRITDVPEMESNEWKHIRIDFECREDANYLGLSKNQFNFWVDGLISQTGPFYFDDSATNFQWNIWSTESNGYNYSIYLDAVGVSWDPAYEIGDNMNPRDAIYSGTELIFYAEGFDTISDNEHLKYFWNFGDNQTAFGETILHTYRKPGKYRIQLITMDLSGYYSIDEKYIWIDNYYPNVDITKFTYGATTYDFSDDVVGEPPNGWYISSWENFFGMKTEVVEYVDGFYKVVKIADGLGLGGIWTCNTSGLPMTNPSKPGTLNLTSGTIEFWLYTNDTYNSMTYFSLFEWELTNGITIAQVNSTWYIMNNTIQMQPFEFTNSWKFQNNTWTHFRIDFCCDDSQYMGLNNDTFIIYANNNPSPVFQMVHSKTPDITNITSIGLWAAGFSIDSSVTYVDNIGFSWDPDYNVGNNLLAGQIISFDEGDTIILECMSDDTYLDYLQLIYQWGYIFSDVDDIVDFGWHYPHIFINNNDGEIVEEYSIISLVSDPYLAWDADAYNMLIDNVPPSYNIFNSQVLTNISATIYSSADYEANFTISLIADNETQDLYNIIFPSDATDDLIFYNLTLYRMDLNKSWDIFINQTAREGGVHTLTLYLQYSNGYEFTKSFIFNGTINEQEFNLNEFWKDSETHMPKIPIIFNSYICDPSNDIVDLSIDYAIELIYEVSYSGDSLSRTFQIDNDVTCYLQTISESGKKYTIFKFIKEIDNVWEEILLSKSFPVSYYIDFVADMTNIDVMHEVDIIFNSIANLNQIKLNKTHYYIYADFLDGDYDAVTQEFNTGFHIEDDFQFDNLAPQIYFNLPYNLTEDKTYEFLAEINDLNGDNITVKFKFGLNFGSGQSEYVPNYLGNNTYGLNYTYTEAGDYIFSVLATDGVSESKVIQSIKIINQVPYAKIRTFINATYEDELIKFEAEIYDTDSDINNLRYYWDFGDGTLSPDNPSLHAFSRSGDYMVRLFVKDDNGELYIAHYNITVLDKPPEIIGPFSFVGIEGQTTILDVEIADSISDAIMEYTWDIYEAYQIYNATYTFLNVSEGELPGYPFTDF